MAGHLNIVSFSGSEIEATMSFDPTEVKELSIWLLFLLKVPGFLKRFSFKQNTAGRIKCKLVLTKRPDWQMRLAEAKVSAVSYIMKSEG
jgi:hypothetical protein